MAISKDGCVFEALGCEGAIIKGGDEKTSRDIWWKRKTGWSADGSAFESMC